MRLKLAGLIIGLGVISAPLASSYACAFHDQAAADGQQQTAQAQTQQPAQTSTQ